MLIGHGNKDFPRRFFFIFAENKLPQEPIEEHLWRKKISIDIIFKLNSQDFGSHLNLSLLEVRWKFWYVV